MATSPVNEIESQFAQLSPEAQLSVLERLVHRVRVGLAGHRASLETQLVAMAADPEIQSELGHINAELADAESDGLVKL
jgi:hypothetical protein